MKTAKKQTKPKKRLCKITIEGETPSDVLGVTLRESIQKLALKSPFLYEIRGHVRNLKHTNRVEMVVLGTASLIGVFEKNISTHLPEENPLMEDGTIYTKKEWIVDGSLKEEIEKYDPPFKVIREDELTEMTWALQSAGKALLIQETIRSENLKRGMDGEISSISLFLEEIKKGSALPGKKIRYLSMESLLRVPPKKCAKMGNPNYKKYMGLISKLYDACIIFNDLVTGGAPYDNSVFSLVIAEIGTTADQIKEILKKNNLKRTGGINYYGRIL